MSCLLAISCHIYIIAFVIVWLLRVYLHGSTCITENKTTEGVSESNPLRQQCSVAPVAHFYVDNVLLYIMLVFTMAVQNLRVSEETHSCSTICPHIFFILCSVCVITSFLPMFIQPLRSCVCTISPSSCQPSPTSPTRYQEMLTSWSGWSLSTRSTRCQSVGTLRVNWVCQ